MRKSHLEQLRKLRNFHNNNNNNNNNINNNNIIIFIIIFFFTVFHFFALYFEKIALLLANQNLELFSCILLGWTAGYVG